ncbi:MAG: hypothetical protein IPK37_00135 [Austwickia sp.]|nr:MAG: hypothetical protein IPK37_00135 [Austwickia sp.]
MLSQCRPEVAIAWARRGLGSVLLAQLDGWTVVAPDGPPKARFPYDDAVRTLAGRPVGLRMRPALGFFQVGRQAVVTCHPPQWRAVERWAVWTPRDAFVSVPGLPTARPSDLTSAAGLDVARSIRAESALHDIFADGGSDAAAVLSATLLELGLPGRDLVVGETRVADLPGVRRIVPKDRHARSFDKIVLEEERYRMEEEGP